MRRRLRVCALMWEPADFQRGVAVRRGAASLRHLHKGWGLHAADVQAAVFTVLVNICNIMNIMVYLALLHLSNCWWIRNQKKKTVQLLVLVSICSLLGFCVSYGSFIYIINL